MRIATLPLLLLFTFACEDPEGIERDLDGDGFVGDQDCNEDDPTVHVGAAEICNGRDENCDGLADEGVAQLYYSDADGDGYGDIFTEVFACNPTATAVGNALDCNDGDPNIKPTASEVCNDVDDNCDDLVDNETGPFWYFDADSDGFGTAEATSEPVASPVQACEAPEDPATGTWSTTSDDCDDAEFTVYPGADEVCADGLDNDCDGDIDDADSEAGSTWYADTDGDTYGDASTTMLACTQPSGFVVDMTDCDDGEGTANPGALEDCTDGLDNDCDGDADSDDDECAGRSLFYAGTFETSITLGSMTVLADSTASAGNFNAFVMRWDDDGSIPWALGITTPVFSQVERIVASETAGLVVATGISHPDGAPYTVTFESAGSSPSIALSPSQQHTFFAPNPTEPEAWVAAWDLDGDLQWARNIGPTATTSTAHAFWPVGVDIAGGEVVVTINQYSSGDETTLMDVSFGADDTGAGGLVYAGVEEQRFSGWTFKLDAATGVPVTSTLVRGLAGGPASAAEMAPTTVAFGASGQVAIGGNVDGTGAASVDVIGGASTAVPGPMTSGGAWVGSAGATATLNPAWVYDINSPDADTLDAVDMLPSGDLLVRGGTSGDTLTLSNGSGSTLLALLPAPYPNGFIARYEDDGSSIRWARAVHSTGGIQWIPGGHAVDTSTGLLFSAIAVDGDVVLGPGETNEETVTTTTDTLVIASDLATGDHVWSVLLDGTEVLALDASPDGEIDILLSFVDTLDLVDSASTSTTPTTGTDMRFGRWRIDDDGQHLGFDEIGTGLASSGATVEATELRP